jgi:hypothetical protein
MHDGLTSKALQGSRLPSVDPSTFSASSGGFWVELSQPFLFLLPTDPGRSPFAGFSEFTNYLLLANDWLSLCKDRNASTNVCHKVVKIHPYSLDWKHANIVITNITAGRTLSPMASMAFTGGPTNVIPLSSSARAKCAFSDRKPYPGATCMSVHIHSTIKHTQQPSHACITSMITLFASSTWTGTYTSEPLARMMMTQVPTL